MPQGRAGPSDLPDLSRYGRLAEYRRKRRFDITPEPPPRPGRTPRAGRRLAFVVQKHRAGHLHYDVRLEHEGVMLSWAVPKGPSLDPAVKRLAMETEPHPVDYNDFEGVIPEGEYGGGTVMIWDRGTWAPEVDDVGRAYRAGRLKFSFDGRKLRGSWALVRTRGPRQWLLIKHRDEHASDEDLTLTRPRSVVSRRTMAAIARAAGASPRQEELALAADPPAADRGVAEPRRTRPARAASGTRTSPAAGPVDTAAALARIRSLMSASRSGAPPSRASAARASTPRGARARGAKRA